MAENSMSTIYHTEYNIRIDMNTYDLAMDQGKLSNFGFFRVILFEGAI